MSQKNDANLNPIVNTIGNVKIRKVNYFTLRLNEHEYERLVKLSYITGIPISKIIAFASQACPICGNDHVMITLPLSLLSVKKQSTGGSAQKRIKT